MKAAMKAVSGFGVLLWGALTVSCLRREPGTSDAQPYAIPGRDAAHVTDARDGGAAPAAAQGAGARDWYDAPSDRPISRSDTAPPVDTGAGGMLQDASSIGDAFRFPEEPPPGCVPLCLWRLFAECTRAPEETCSGEDHSGNVVARCYSSGARVVTWRSERKTIEYKPDGSVCLTYQAQPSATGRITTYWDGQGRVVAVARDLDQYGERVEVDCDGKKTTAELSDRCSIVFHACNINGKCAP